MDDFNNIVVIIIIWYSKGVGRLVHLGSWNSVVFVSTFPTRAGRKLIRGIGPVKVTRDSKGGKCFFQATVSSCIAPKIVALLTSTPSNITPKSQHITIVNLDILVRSDLCLIHLSTMHGATVTDKEGLKTTHTRFSILPKMHIDQGRSQTYPLLHGHREPCMVARHDPRIEPGIINGWK